jgi:hypothetical protein
MSTDAASPRRGPRQIRPKPWKLPRLVEVHSKLVHFEKPKLYAQDSRLSEANEVVEIVVETSEPFPDNAYGPVLNVGDHVLKDSERIGERTYRFFGYEPDSLQEGSTISLGWFGDAEMTQYEGRKFRFEVEEEVRRSGPGEEKEK